MALLTKDKINQFGVQEEYWRVLSINLNVQYQYCDITLGAYASAETRESNCEPMNIKKVRAKWDEQEFLSFFTAKAMNEENVNIYNQVYKYVKQKDEYFKDAIDC